MRETTLHILQHGDVELFGMRGYGLLGDENAVCFWIDTVKRAVTTGYTETAEGVPVLMLGPSCDSLCTDKGDTLVSFPEFVGWRVHAGGDGKTVAVALMNRAAEAAGYAQRPEFPYRARVRPREEQTVPVEAWRSMPTWLLRPGDEVTVLGRNKHNPDYLEVLDDENKNHIWPTWFLHHSTLEALEGGPQ